MTMTEHEHGSHASQLIAPTRVGIEADESSMPEANSCIAGDDPRAGVWSIRRAIELLDEAIDRIGSQLARTADASMDWSDEPPGVG